MNLGPLLAHLARFPWKSTALTLGERFREDRLGLTASSLTFTTTIALVPFFTVALAVFTAFPMFGKLQDALQAWLVQSLIPDAIARQVLGYLTQFAGKASRLGAVGLTALFFTALALVLTIDRTLNGIWRVRRTRPLAQRVLIYWAVMTLAPLLLGASLSMSSYVLSASRGIVNALPGMVQVSLDVIEFFLLAAGFAALYRYVPNTPVRRGHAWAGGARARAARRSAPRAQAAGGRAQGVSGGDEEGAEPLPRDLRRSQRGVDRGRSGHVAHALRAAADDLREGRQSRPAGAR